MKEEKINTIKAWLELKLVWDIQVFIGFANFYRCFIQNFSKIATPLTLMLKASSQPVSILLATSVDNSEVIDSSGENDRKLAKSNFTKPMYRVEESSFLTPNARQTFTKLRQAFTKAPILNHFVPDCHI